MPDRPSVSPEDIPQSVVEAALKGYNAPDDPGFGLALRSSIAAALAEYERLGCWVRGQEVAEARAEGGAARTAEIVGWLRERAGSAYPERRGKLHDIADDLVTRFPEDGSQGGEEVR